LNCPKCGAENPENAYFCGSCGYQLKSAMDQPQGPADLGRPADPLGGRPLDTNAPGAGLAPPPNTPSEPAPYTPPAPVAPPKFDYLPVSDYSKEPARAAPTLPPKPTSPQQQPYQQYQQPNQPYQPQNYQPPQGQPQYGPPPSSGYNQGGYGQQQYGMPLYGQPPDSNTSGMGAGYSEPMEASGWTFAGCVPFGIYAFVMGNVLWGVIGLVTQFSGLYLIYAIYIGIQGKKLAWQSRRFDSVQQFGETQRTWNIAGVILLVIGIPISMLQMLFGFAMLAGLMSSEGMQ
jgi:hypothetical protein